MNMREIIEKVNPNSLDYNVINLEALQADLQESKGAKIVSLTTITVPDLKQLIDRDCYFDYELIKISYINGIVNFNYANAVNAQRKREAEATAKKLGLIKVTIPETFIPVARKWGTRLTDSPFVSHVLKTTGEHKLYLEVRILRSIEHVYYQPSKKRIIDDEIVKPYLRDKSSSTKIHQDLEKEIILRDYHVKNIACIVIDEKGFFIEENLK
jgi:hypothetical protein